MSAGLRLPNGTAAVRIDRRRGRRSSRSSGRPAARGRRRRRGSGADRPPVFIRAKSARRLSWRPRRRCGWRSVCGWQPGARLLFQRQPGSSASRPPTRRASTPTRRPGRRQGASNVPPAPDGCRAYRPSPGRVALVAAALLLFVLPSMVAGHPRPRPRRAPACGDEAPITRSRRRRRPTSSWPAISRSPGDGITPEELLAANRRSEPDDQSAPADPSGARPTPAEPRGRTPRGRAQPDGRIGAISPRGAGTDLFRRPPPGPGAGGLVPVTRGGSVGRSGSELLDAQADRRKA
jgi:hypothetical protein